MSLRWTKIADDSYRAAGGPIIVEANHFEDTKGQVGVWRCIMTTTPVYSSYGFQCYFGCKTIEECMRVSDVFADKMIQWIQDRLYKDLTS